MNKNINNEAEVAVKSTSASTKAKKAVKPELTPNTYVPCLSNIRNGELVYHSQRTNGYVVRWLNYLDEQLIELSELNAMKSTAIGFFTKNWIIIPDSFELKDEVLEYLHIKQFYNTVADPRAVNAVLNAPLDEMQMRIGELQPSARDLVVNAAKAAIADGSLDSFKRIAALEEALGCKLT